MLAKRKRELARLQALAAWRPARPAPDDQIKPAEARAALEAHGFGEIARRIVGDASQ